PRLASRCPEASHSLRGRRETARPAGLAQTEALSRPQRRGRVKRRTDEGAGSDVEEAQGLPQLPVPLELGGGDVLLHGEVVGRRLEVLADGEEVALHPP